jgi:hypothetical protein
MYQMNIFEIFTVKALNTLEERHFTVPTVQKLLSGARLKPMPLSPEQNHLPLNQLVGHNLCCQLLAKLFAHINQKIRPLAKSSAPHKIYS